jgi:hypothetical protein
MTFRYSVELRNAGIDARIKAVGPGAVLKICAQAQGVGRTPAGELVTMTLPSPWMSPAEDGAASLTGQWQATASAEGKAKSYVIYSRDGTPHIEGSIPDDMTLDNTSIAPGQMVSVSAFVIRSGNG